MKYLLLFLLFFLISIPAKDLPWPRDKDIKYSFTQDTVDIGFALFSIHDTLIDYKPAYIIKESLHVATPQVLQDGHSHLLMDSRGRPLMYRGILNVKADKFPRMAGEFKYDMVFRGKDADIKVVRNGALIQNLTSHLAADKYYCFENNKLGQFALMSFFIADVLGGELEKKAFHINSAVLMDIKFKVVKSGARMIKGMEVPYRRIDYYLNGKRHGQIWMTNKGRLLRDIEQNGKLVIKLVEEENAASKPQKDKSPK